jgi:hypothetical protein
VEYVSVIFSSLPIFFVFKHVSRLKLSPWCVYVILIINSVAWVRERTIPTKRPPLVGEVSVYVNPLLLYFECLSQSLRILECMSWQLSPSHRVLLKPLTSVYVSICVSLLSLLRKGSIKCTCICGSLCVFLLYGSWITIWWRRSCCNEELSEASFSMQSESYQRKIDYQFFPELIFLFAF